MLLTKLFQLSMYAYLYSIHLLVQQVMMWMHFLPGVHDLKFEFTNLISANIFLSLKIQAL